MKIIFFTHPNFTEHQSMPRFARMLADGMTSRGHQVEVRTAQSYFTRIPVPRMLHKWLGYIDQYIVFPTTIRFNLKRYPSDTLFVFTDHALGPWVPMVAERPHVIHCHDFLAQRSAQGKIPENPIGWSGRQYQAYIHRGYSKGNHFISVSHTTRNDLHNFLIDQPIHSEVVYNGLNQNFSIRDADLAQKIFGQKIGVVLSNGYLLHIGGNQWYKNRVGVVELYNAWRNNSNSPLPLLLIGQAPSKALMDVWQASPFQKDIHILPGIDDESIQLAYVGATAFLFPSLAEGFGWPIAEAMASGCPVITTGEAPMTEVGGDAAFYITRRPNTADSTLWATTGAQVIDHVVGLGLDKRKAVVKAGLVNARRFEAETALNTVEEIYKSVLKTAGHI